jgi:chemotaxis protein histidine kinase CheA/ActR/RegA family two-component response regulator
MKTQIKDLQAKTASEAHLLYEAVVGLVDEGAEKVASAIEVAQNYVKSIGEAADSAQLFGLSAVCQQTCQNLAKLHTCEPAKRREELGTLVERWPRLVSNYLYSPLDVNSHHRLISFLQNAQWPQPARDEFVSELREDFFRHIQERDTSQKIIPRSKANEKLNESIVREAGSEGFQDEFQLSQKTVKMTAVGAKKTPAGVLMEAKLADLYRTIVEMSETLSAALNQFTTLEIENEAFSSGIEQYTDTVQSFWELAEKNGLKGFQEVCTFINDNVFKCSSQSVDERLRLKKLFALWPSLTLDYLESPDSGAKKLVDSLRLESWPVPLSEARATFLTTQLRQDYETILVEIDRTQEMPNSSVDEMELTLVAKEDGRELSVIEPELSVSERELVADNGKNATKLELPALEAQLPAVQLPRHDEELPSKVQLPDDDKKLSAEIEKLPGDDEKLPSEKGELSALARELPLKEGESLEGELPGDDEKLSGDDEKFLLAPTEKLPNDDEKLSADDGELSPAKRKNLPDDQLPTSHDEKLSGDDEKFLLAPTEELPSDDKKLSGDDGELPTLAEKLPYDQLPITDDSQKGLVLAEPEVLDLLIGQVREVAENNANLINELIEAEAGSETFLTAAMSYTENVQAVWDAADMAKLEGLAEVCTFINDNVMVLGGKAKKVRSAAREVLSAWPELVVAYLHNPASQTGALVSHLQNTHWPTPLDLDAASRLQQRLMRSAKAVPDAASAIGLSPTGTPVEEEIIELAAPEILELVCGQIADSGEGMSAALEVCVSMENETEAFLEAIEDYTNQVQDIWDAADMAGLSGLQEVCTFVNDNLMAFSVQDKATRKATQSYFIGWPANVLEYLQAPATGAPRLVAYLKESGWPVPLEADAADNLLRLLKKPSEKASAEAEVAASEISAPGFFEPESVTQEASPQELTPIKAEISEEISLGSSDILEILESELESAKEDLATELHKFLTHNPTEAAFTEALENYTEQVQRLYVASEMLGLEGLQTVCTFVTDNMTALSVAQAEVRKKTKGVLEKWPELVLAYVRAPAESVVPLVNHFRESQWAQPLTDDAAHALLNQLVTGSTAAEEADEGEAYSRQTVANPEDVSLTLPEDVNQELLEAYLQETPQHAQNFSATIQKIIQNPEIAEIEYAQRTAHTLKGSSNIIGIKGIANIAHHLEDTLEYLAKHQVVPPKALTDTMVEAADCLEIMVDALLGEDEPPPQAQQVLQSVLDWANRIDKGQLDAPPAPSRPVQEAAPAATSDDKKAKAESQAKSDRSVAAGTPEQFLRVPTKTIDELMRLVGELSISVGQIQERLKHVIQSTRTLTAQDLVLHKKTFELENLVDVRGITGVENRYKNASTESENFDPLEFEEYNELHSVAHSFIESIADNRELAMSIREDLAELETMFIHQERLNKEFQASVMTTRMVPVNTIISKLQRNVRQTCRMTGKKAELEVTGTDILIDSEVLTNLADPLQHILRNAIDHGIENADERAILGKPEVGQIKLSFYREGNNIVVKCEDNGQGLNYTNIRFTAIQRGLITENQDLSEKELARLILMSGFSTKSGVTQVSGRGVGMDVVHTNIRQMKGTLDLVSETGKGTTILIKLPMTLVTVHVLLVRISDRQFGIPTNHLEQALAPGVGEFHRIGDEITLKMGKNFYGLKYLADLLNMPGDKVGIEEPETRPIILVHEETGITAVIVDELLDTHDLVMKSMGKYVKNIHGVAGASILGDGSLVPLLDLPELLRSPMQAAMSSYMAEHLQEGSGIVNTAAVPHVMIVDDSLSVRKSLSLLVEDAGFETLLAKDGIEAIEIMNQTRPNVMLVDMEMPRMNGLELTAHVRANRATEKLPIFMITSRTTEKHRAQAKEVGVNAYLTKPYQDTELLALIDKALAEPV